MHRHAISLILCTAAVLLAGCSKNSSSGSEETSAASAETTAVSATEVNSTTAAASSTAVSSEASTGSTEETTGEEQKTTESEEKRAEECSDCLELAQKFYQAYLDHDAETVYSLFCIDEIDGYNKLIEPQLNGISPDEAFRKAAVIKAIEASMDNVRKIMEYYATDASDKWSFKVTMDDLSDIDPEVLEDYNKSLGTDYTKSFTCQYMIYNDDTNGKSFTGNSVSFVEKEGKWYLSYSSLMGSDLIYFMDFQ